MINTKEDFNNSTPEQQQHFLTILRGSMKRMVDLTVYPVDYDQNLNEGDEGFVARQIVEIEDLSTIERFGFTKEELA